MLNAYRIVWRRDNGRCFPATHHVLATVYAEDEAAALALTAEAYPALGDTVAPVLDAQIGDVMAQLEQSAKEQATQEGWDGEALKSLAKEQHEKELAEIAAMAAQSEQQMRDRQAAALAAAKLRVGTMFGKQITPPAETGTVDAAPPADAGGVSDSQASA